MLAEDRWRAGEPEAALQQLQDQVRREPANPRLRIFLFQLLALLGQWGRALNQLTVAGELDAGALAMVQTYREALHCEVLRAEVFSGKRTPLVFGRPDAWIALLIQAHRLLAQGEGKQAAEIRAQALEATPATGGTLDGTRFEWIMDGDARLGPVLEAIVNGRYYWIPFRRIRAIRIEKPEDLRDLVWTPAQFTWANGGESVGLIPTRYPGSEGSADPQIRRARRTDWQEDPWGAFTGLGQRMFYTDGGEYPLLDVRAIDLDSPADDAPADAAGAAPPTTVPGAVLG